MREFPPLLACLFLFSTEDRRNHLGYDFHIISSFEDLSTPWQVLFLLFEGVDIVAKVEKKICTKCGDEKRLGDFYKSNSELNSDGKLQICKDCVANRYDKLLTIYEGKSMSAFKHLLTNLDEFFSEELYNECVMKDGTKFIGEYFKVVNRDKNYREKTSLNNTLESNETKDIQLEDGVISQEMIDFWGLGYKASEYMKLSNKYKMYSEHYPSKRLQEQEILKQLAELDLMKEQCRILGDRNGYDKISTQIRRTMEDLNVLPKQSAEEEEQLTLGNIIKMIEYEEPIPTTSPEFDDVNKIEKIMEKYFITPFKRVLGLKNKDFGDIDE